jgi:hypothetical protein
MVHDYSFFGSTADFVIKKGTFRIFTGFGHLQTSQTSGRNSSLIIYFQYFGNELIYFHCDGDQIIYFGKKIRIKIFISKI